MAFIYAFDKRYPDRNAQVVPDRWLKHPKLGQHLSLKKPAQPTPDGAKNKGQSADKKEK